MQGQGGGGSTTLGRGGPRHQQREQASLPRGARSLFWISRFFARLQGQGKAGGAPLLEGAFRCLSSAGQRRFQEAHAPGVIRLRRREDALFWDRPRVVYHREYFSIRRQGGGSTTVGRGVPTPQQRGPAWLPRGSIETLRTRSGGSTGPKRLDDTRWMRGGTTVGRGGPTPPQRGQAWLPRGSRSRPWFARLQGQGGGSQPAVWDGVCMRLITYACSVSVRGS